MKTCSFEKQINSYLDGELSGAKLRSFEAHIEACPRCREEVEQYKEVLERLRGMRDREVPPMLHERLHAALSNEIAKGDGRVKRKFNPWAITAVASAAVICLVGGIALLANGNTANNNGLLMGAAGKGTGSGQNYDMASPANEARAQSKSSGIAPMPAPTMAAAATMAPAAWGESGESEKDDGGYKGAAVIRGDTADYAAAQDVEKPAGENLAQTGEDKRKLIYTAYVVTETREYDKCKGEVNAMLGKYGGYVQSSQENGVPEGYESKQGRTMMISLRVPIDKYGTAMAELQAMGNLLKKDENTEDVSRQYVDTKARADTLVKQRDRYMALLDKADSTESIVALQTEITNLTVQIEQDTAQLRYWDDMVSYSTITVELRELVIPKSIEQPDPADPDLNTRTSGAFYQTLNDMKKGLESFAVWFVGFLPWLAILVVIAGIAVAIVVPVTRKHRREALKKAAEAKKKEE